MVARPSKDSYQMQSRQSGRRRRGGGGGNQPRPLNQPMGGQGGNRLENRVRGNATQLLEKYKQLARDAHQSGDRVAAEYYLQHADHYFRVLNDVRIRQEEMRSRRGAFDPVEDETEEDGDAAMTETDPRGERGRPDRPEPRGEPRVLAEANGHGPAEDEDADMRRDRPVALSDGEAALMAFGGAPASGMETPGDAEGDDEAPARPVRRRGRPRKTAAPAVEG
jgi:hypothetical protein